MVNTWYPAIKVPKHGGGWCSYRISCTIRRLRKWLALSLQLFLCFPCYLHEEMMWLVHLCDNAHVIGGVGVQRWTHPLREFEISNELGRFELVLELRQATAKRCCHTLRHVNIVDSSWSSTSTPTPSNPSACGGGL